VVVVVVVVVACSGVAENDLFVVFVATFLTVFFVVTLRCVAFCVARVEPADLFAVRNIIVVKRVLVICEVNDV